MYIESYEKNVPSWLLSPGYSMNSFFETVLRCVQVHEFAQSHSDDNRGWTLFTWFLYYQDHGIFWMSFKTTTGF